MVCVMQIARGGGRKAFRAGADPLATAAGYLSDNSREGGAREGTTGKGERTAGCHAAATEAGDGEAKRPGAVWGTAQIFACLHCRVSYIFDFH